LSVQRKTVLVVDDDASSRFVLSKALEGLGCRAVVAEDGVDVPELVAKERFDLLVLDLYMPGMNGFELVRRLRKPTAGLLPAPRTSSDVPVVIVSGESDPDSLANIKALGADYHLSKPIDLTEFEDCVRAALRGRQRSKKAP
jgi:CheY-like chemotaxis protein